MRRIKGFSQFIAMFFAAGVLLASGGMYYFLGPKLVDYPHESIENFEECVAAGNPVLESFPRQCRTEKGKLFVEIVE